MGSNVSCFAKGKGIRGHVVEVRVTGRLERVLSRCTDPDGQWAAEGKGVTFAVLSLGVLGERRVT